MPVFTEVTYQGTTQKGNAYVVAKDDQGCEVAVFGKSVQVVRDAITNGTVLPGEVEPNGESPQGDKRFKYEHPDFKQQRGGRGYRGRDPIQELVGIAHYQAMSIVFEKRPPEDTESLSKFWGRARPHIKTMALEIAQDRLNLQREIASTS
jgi:hypothetical protein